MNVIEKMKDILSGCALMDEFNGIHIDYTNPKDDYAALFPNGSVKTGEDIIGNPQYRISFRLYSVLHAPLDYDRLKNSDFLLMLTYYLDSVKYVGITETINGIEYPGEITRIICSNALFYDVPTGDLNDGIRYQLQISVEYTIEIE